MRIKSAIPNLKSEILPNSPAKRIVLVQEQRSFRGDKRATGDSGADGALGAVQPAIRPLQRTADNALLYPRLVLGQVRVGSQACQFGAGAGAAGRAIIRFPWAQNKIACVAGASRRAEQLNMIDFRKTLSGHGLADFPGLFDQLVDMRRVKLPQRLFD